MSVRVLVVDDQALVRSGFAMILSSEEGIDVVGDAADGLEAIDRVAELDPDVVVMDIRMPNLDGVAATRRILERPHPPKVLILTTFDVDDLVYAALRAGASGFILKDTPPEELIRAVRVVAEGNALIDPSVTRRLIETFADRLPDPDAPATAAGPPDAGSTTGPAGGGDRAGSLDLLTDREVEVLHELAKGRSNAEIAGALYVSETTVKTHVGRVLSKLGLRDRVQAVVFAYESGLVRPGV